MNEEAKGICVMSQVEKDAIEQYRALSMKGRYAVAEYIANEKRVGFNLAKVPILVSAYGL